MFFSAITYVCLIAAGASNSVAASTNATQSLIAFNPRITFPTTGMTWVPGTTHNVTWDTTNIPCERLDSTGVILLGYNGTYSENLDIDHPLASSFSIQQGYVPVTLPKNTKHRDDYFIVRKQVAEVSGSTALIVKYQVVLGFQNGGKF
ncbi:hypothetical protein H0H92_004429 [Tricholoma furcatifolium]|nr:hypothetical protein H0H92_004429 [Tricholoma furcatifolium]